MGPTPLSYAAASTAALIWMSKLVMQLLNNCFFLLLAKGYTIWSSLFYITTGSSLRTWPFPEMLYSIEKKSDAFQIYLSLKLSRKMKSCDEVENITTFPSFVSKYSLRSYSTFLRRFQINLVLVSIQIVSEAFKIEKSRGTEFVPEQFCTDNSETQQGNFGQFW